MAKLVLERIQKQYSKEDEPAVKDVDLSVEDREFVVLVGPSGCGKSTILRMIAGLVGVSGGRIHIEGTDVTELPPKDRDIAMVFQNYALFPHMDVYGNIAFGMKIRGTAKAEIDRRVREAASILELDGLLKKKPAQLSGGQRQRVAVGRAIVRRPKRLTNASAVARPEERQ